MSVRGNFYYKDIIPSGTDYTLIYNLRVPVQSTISRILLIDFNDILVYPLTPLYIRFGSNGSKLEIRCNDGINAESGPDINSIRLNYIIISFDSVTNRLYFWDPNTFTSSWISWTPALSNTGHVVHMNYGTSTGIDLSSTISPDINYFTILNKKVDIDDVKSIASGIHPLENLNILRNIHFFREFPHKSHTNYFTSIGTALPFNGSSGSYNIGIKQLGSYNFLYPPERGYKFKISSSISFKQSSSYLYNNTINLSNIILLNQLIGVPVERTFQLNTYLDLQENWDLVDKYLIINNDLMFITEGYMGFERTFDISTSIKLPQLLKNWDGKISNILTFSTAVTSSIKVFEINTDVSIDYSEVGHNIKLDDWSDFCYTICDVVLAEHEDYDVDNNNQGFVIVEEITISKNITRILNNNITFNNVVDAYVVKQVDLENYG